VEDREMLQATGFDHLNMNIRNFKETTDFYQNHLGFKIVEEGKSGRGNDYKIIGIPGKLYLAIYESNDSSLDKGQSHINHFGIHIKNYDVALAYIKQKKIPYQYGGHVDYGDSRSIYIMDPNGYEIELSEVFGSALGV
jgi:lactoylglutathione lyase